MIFIEKYINSVVKGIDEILILGGGYIIIQLINTGLSSFTDYIISKQQISIASNLQKNYLINILILIMKKYLTLTYLI